MKTPKPMPAPKPAPAPKRDTSGNLGKFLHPKKGARRY